MEEQKNLNNQQIEEPSYEQLKEYCNQLMIQRNQLGQKLQQVTNVVGKLPWLFEVIKAKDSFDYFFVEKCIKEVEEILTPPEPEDDKKEEE